MPALAVLTAAVLFGTTGTARALGLSGADVNTVGAARIAVGGLLLAAVMLVRRQRVRRRTVAAPASAPVRLRDPAVAAAIGVGVLGVVLYQPAFFEGVAVNGVAIGTLVALGSAPTITGVVAWLCFRRRPEARWFLATAGAVVGVGLLSGVLGTGAAGPRLSLAGVAASLAAGCAYAMYTLSLKVLLDRGMAQLDAIGIVFGGAGVVGLCWLVAVGGGELLAPGPLVAVLWLGVAATALAYLAFSSGLARLPASTVSTLTLAEPLVATLLGVLLLGERFGAVDIVGALVLGAALLLLAVRRPAAVGVPGESAGSPVVPGDSTTNSRVRGRR